MRAAVHSALAAIDTKFGASRTRLSELGTHKNTTQRLTAYPPKAYNPVLVAGESEEIPSTSPQRSRLPGARLGSRPGDRPHWGNRYAEGTVNTRVGYRCGGDFREVCNTTGPSIKSGSLTRIAGLRGSFSDSLGTDIWLLIVPSVPGRERKSARGSQAGGHRGGARGSPRPCRLSGHPRRQRSRRGGAADRGHGAGRRAAQRRRPRRAVSQPRSGRRRAHATTDAPTGERRRPGHRR